MLGVNVNVNRSRRDFCRGESWVDFERKNARMFHLVKKLRYPLSSRLWHIQEERRRRIIRELLASALPELAWKFALYRRLGRGGCFRLNFQGKEVECSMEENLMVNPETRFQLVKSFQMGIFLHDPRMLNYSLRQFDKQLLFT